ncbi:MAG TPA: hypothetical protein VF145_11575 [Chitinophagaceae bacterium]
MRTYQNFLQTTIILLVIGMNAWVIGGGIRNESGWTIIFSIGSLVALGYCIHLFRRLREVDSADESENY